MDDIMFWKPITEEEFNALLESQYRELDGRERDIFEKYRIKPWKAILHRSNTYDDEYVFVVCQFDDGVLYFDDVEYGFNISTVDKHGRILNPGGNQASLKEAINWWFIA